METVIYSFLNSLGVQARFAELTARFLSHIDVPQIAVQAILILVLGIAGAWFVPRTRRFVFHIIALLTPKAWVPPLERAFGSVTAPLFWLVSLWLTLAVARSLNFEFRLIAAATSLLAAWTTIRLLSFAVRNSILSATISVAAWSIAALSILGLLGPLTHELDAMAFVLGRMRISALAVVRALFVLAALLWFATLTSNFLEHRISKTQALTPSLQALLVRVLRLVLPALAVVVALSVVGIDLTALTVFSGAVGVGVGLGLQRTVANLVAGITLILGKSIKPGDVIAYKDTYGWVTHMGARYVAIATRDGSEYLVPNEYFMSNGVENWSYSNPNRRLHIRVGVAYETDLHRAIAICIEAAKSVDRVLKMPQPVCLVTEFGESSVNLEVRAWINDPKNGVTNVKSAVMLEIWDRFAAAGIRIPFPQRDVHLIPMPGGRPATGT